jgi:hypothetical protein
LKHDLGKHVVILPVRDHKFERKFDHVLHIRLPASDEREPKANPGGAAKVPACRWNASRLRDDNAVRAWRNVEKHRLAQAAGRCSIFADYRLRVAAVIRDYGMNDRAQAPEDSRAAHAA